MSDVLLRVRNIALWGHHGCERCEIEKGGPFEVSIDASYPEPADALADTFTDRVDYALLAERAVAIFNARRYQLIEPLAAVMAETLLEEFLLLTQVTITIRKLEPVIPLKLACSEVVLTRRRC